MIGDRLHADGVGQGVQAAAAFLVFPDNLSHGVSDIESTTVADGKIHVQARVLFASCSGRVETANQPVGQVLALAHMLNPPIAKTRELISEGFNDVDQGIEFFLVPPVNVVRREQVERDHFDAVLITPAQELVDLVRTSLVTVVGRVERALLRPSTVPVENQADMARVLDVFDLSAEPPGIETVEETHSGKGGSLRHSTTLVQPTNLCRPVTIGPRPAEPNSKVGGVTDTSASSENTLGDDPQPTSEGLQLPLLEEASAYRDLEKKPTWRGWIHLGTFPLAMAGGILLLVLASGATAIVGTAIFMASSLALFGVSAVYHRFHWSPGVKAVLRRLDHANIFFLIAGTYTPISLLALPWEQGRLLLGVVWSGALLGILARVLWLNAPRWVYVPLYLALGWAAVMYLPELWAASIPMVILVFGGGVLYSLGAVVYGAKWPDPSPEHFGFHEIFHTLTALAFLSHWTAVLLVVLSPPAG